MMSKTSKTSVEAKDRWKKQNYKTYQINLRIEDDKDLIELVEWYKSWNDNKGVSYIFRMGCDVLRQMYPDRIPGRERKENENES